MSPSEVITLGQNAITITIFLASPLLAVGMAVGITVSIFQAVTQIQEMTLTFVPKIIAVMATLLFFSSWMISKLVDYTSALIISLPELIR